MAKYTATPKMTVLRKEQGLTGEDLAELSGVTQATISRFDRQIRYDINVLISLSRALGVTIEELFTVEEDL